jgi:hypothetical protein
MEQATVIDYPDAPVVGFLRRMAALAEEMLAEGGQRVTGRRWKRPPPQCPEWCARGHRCSAREGNPAGEHRGLPLELRSVYSRMHATRITDVEGRNEMEVVVRVSLAPGEELAIRQGGAVATAIALAVRTTLVQVQLNYVPPAIERAPS